MQQWRALSYSDKMSKNHSASFRAQLVLKMLTEEQAVPLEGFANFELECSLD